MFRKIWDWAEDGTGAGGRSAGLVVMKILQTLSKTDIYEVDRTPVDGLAVKVFLPGYQYCPEKKHQAPHWESPPPVSQPPSNAPDMTGIRFGRFTVIGYLDSSKRVGTKWLCRCDCGRFEQRSGKAIRNQGNAGDRCQQCQHVDYLQKTDKKRQAGVL